MKEVDRGWPDAEHPADWEPSTPFDPESLSAYEAGASRPLPTAQESVKLHVDKGVTSVSDPSEPLSQGKKARRSRHKSKRSEHIPKSMPEEKSGETKSRSRLLPLLLVLLLVIVAAAYFYYSTSSSSHPSSSPISSPSGSVSAAATIGSAVSAVNWPGTLQRLLPSLPAVQGSSADPNSSSTFLGEGSLLPCDGKVYASESSRIARSMVQLPPAGTADQVQAEAVAYKTADAAKSAYADARSLVTACPTIDSLASQGAWTDSSTATFADEGRGLIALTPNGSSQTTTLALFVARRGQVLELLSGVWYKKPSQVVVSDLSPVSSLFDGMVSRASSLPEA